MPAPRFKSRSAPATGSHLATSSMMARRSWGGRRSTHGSRRCSKTSAVLAWSRCDLTTPTMSLTLVVAAARKTSRMLVASAALARCCRPASWMPLVLEDEPCSTSCSVRGPKFIRTTAMVARERPMPLRSCTASSAGAHSPCVSRSRIVANLTRTEWRGGCTRWRRSWPSTCSSSQSSHTCALSPPGRTAIMERRVRLPPSIGPATPCARVRCVRSTAWLAAVDRASAGYAR
mmetsp:Transcript_22807/g.67152  ORF Transcript_22807/g.67152 Transcript_22807/m.67152 type:complete len:232 (-) Transcript_22807:56-751(-)